jgi:hypothetical protein
MMPRRIRRPRRLEVFRLNRSMVIGIAIGFVVGLFVGVNFGASRPPESAPSTMGGSLPPGMPPGMPPGAPMPAPGDNVQSRIATMQAMVAQDPKNHDAWVQLGNDFFDTRQAEKSVDAYSHALQLKPDDANVLTDQGVMYRELRQYDRAVANFIKANQVDPRHMQSLFNLGIVYQHDLNQPKKAIEAWNKVIQSAPQSDQAAQARVALEEIKKSGAQ